MVDYLDLLNEICYENRDLQDLCVVFSTYYLECQISEHMCDGGGYGYQQPKPSSFNLILEVFSQFLYEPPQIQNHFTQ